MRVSYIIRLKYMFSLYWHIFIAHGDGFCKVSSPKCGLHSEHSPSSPFLLPPPCLFPSLSFPSASCHMQCVCVCVCTPGAMDL